MKYTGVPEATARKAPVMHWVAGKELTPAAIQKFADLLHDRKAIATPVDARRFVLCY